MGEFQCYCMSVDGGYLGFHSANLAGQIVDICGWNHMQAVLQFLPVIFLHAPASVMSVFLNHFPS